MSSYERTGWRDQRISERHRKWGIGCTAIDFDFLLLEYDSGEPSAIIEYKHEKARKQYASAPAYRALISLGNSARIPVFACRYRDDFLIYIVTPLNQYAEKWVQVPTELDEKSYVTLLYKIRGKNVTPEFWNSMHIQI